MPPISSPRELLGEELEDPSSRQRWKYHSVPDALVGYARLNKRTEGLNQKTTGRKTKRHTKRPCMAKQKGKQKTDVKPLVHFEISGVGTSK